MKLDLMVEHERFSIHRNNYSLLAGLLLAWCEIVS